MNRRQDKKINGALRPEKKSEVDYPKQTHMWKCDWLIVRQIWEK